MKKILTFIIFMMLSYQSLAVDKSIYYGTWKGKVNGELVLVELLKKKIIIEINGKKITQPVAYEYTYSKNSPYPFLSITFTDKQKTEHLFYLVIGTETKCNKTMLNGFYETTQIIPDSHGKLKSVSNKIELIRN